MNVKVLCCLLAIKAKEMLPFPPHLPTHSAQKKERSAKGPRRWSSLQRQREESQKTAWIQQTISCGHTNQNGSYPLRSLSIMEEPSVQRGSGGRRQPRRESHLRKVSHSFDSRLYEKRNLENDPSSLFFPRALRCPRLDSSLTHPSGSQIKSWETPFPCHFISWLVQFLQHLTKILWIW